ncbi:MAG: FkbM family methyltransferase [Chryseobacterium sp.]|jgi:FkbM family methyltransferase|uniref:FkbM family methyltransferase n=1 Tax=Chryseobacterium sp. TaxID=1871047 RepID=UPI00260BAF5E|nr:FkbM family methyltransferase [Chryseobacterium sp.]MDF2550818.1 FkbM family methyltransferase [Chryseobacterium sp.]
MSFKNYLSKLVFSTKISHSLKSWVSLIVNSKRYSSRFEKNNLDLKDNETFIYHLKIKGKRIDFYLRTFKGDIGVFYEVFWKKTYAKHLSLLKKEPKTIVDLGAHIGITSIYLSLKYPDAKIYAVEASAENFELLKANTNSFKNIVCMNAAAYFEDGFVNFSNDELSYNQKISETGIFTKAISIETLKKNFKIPHIDLMKIDIEGGEIDLLSKQNLWLSSVDNIIIEIHHPYTSQGLNEDLKSFGFNIKRKEDSVLTLTKD